MQNCATVDEAIKMAYSYDRGSLYSGKFAGQYLLADSSGDAAILGFGPDGELVRYQEKQREWIYCFNQFQSCKS